MEGRLKGKLLNKIEKENTPEMYSEDWLKAQILIQRDGGDSFRIKDIITRTSGSFNRRIVQLVSVEDSHSINKEFVELIGNIKTPGSAWYVKK